MVPIANSGTQVVAHRRPSVAVGLCSCIIGLVLLTLPIWAADFSLGEPPLAPSAPSIARPTTRGNTTPRLGLIVNPQNRQEALDFYNNYYLPTQNIAIEWTGDHTSCAAGTTATAFRDAIAQRINYFRAMAGVPADITLDETYNQKAQKAALMMSVNRQLSHKPPPDWKCYSAEGKEAASKSNLAGSYGVAAIDDYITDFGDGNTFVGHRRWLLYPQTQKMGTGDIPPVTGYSAANALWVFDDNTWGPRPATREEFVAWPPPGFVPQDLIFARWSLSYPDADFATATITLNTGGQNVPVKVLPVKTGFGENTLVWEPEQAILAAALHESSGDTNTTVSISNVTVDGQVRDFGYILTTFDASAPPPTPTAWVYLAAVRR